ncbi:MAG: FG-GAP-like repeat-containing protein, partial [Cyanobacteria bacterium J06560_2]
LETDIKAITLQIESQTEQVANTILNVGDTHALETLRAQHLVDEISPRNLSRFGLSANAGEAGATQGVDFEPLEGVVVRRGEEAGLPLSGDRYLGDRPAVVTGDLTGDGKTDLLILSEKSGTQFYENVSTDGGELTFQPQEDKSKVETDAAGQGFSGSEGRLIDADGDGDLDLVWSENGGLKVQLNTPAEGVAFAGSTAAGDFVDQSGTVLGSREIGKTVAFDFADINQDGVLDAVIIDENNQLQTYFGNSAFNLLDGLARTSPATNPFRNITLPETDSLAIKFGNVIADGLPELYVYERGGTGSESYWRFLMPEIEVAEDGAQDVVYRDRTFLDPLTARAGQIGNLESLSFLNEDGADSLFLSKNNGHYKFGTLTEQSNEIVFDTNDPNALLQVKSLQDDIVELSERVRLQLLTTDDLTANQGLDRTVDVIIQDDDRPGVTFAYVSNNGADAKIVSSHFTPSDEPDQTQREGQQSEGFYVLKLDSRPQENVSLILRNTDSDRLQFERIHPLAVTVNANGSLSIGSRLANAADDYTIEFKSDLVTSVSRDGQGHYQLQLNGDTAGTLGSAIAGKSLSEIQASATVQNILKQVAIQIDSDSSTYRGGLGLDANQLLQERISITPQKQMKLTVLPGSWEQQILLRPVVPENLTDDTGKANPRLSITIDSSDQVYGQLPALLTELAITDNDTAG